jgi:glycopeptide antibiotics resistance protein
VKHRIIAILTVAYVAVIAALTLGPQPTDGATKSIARAIVGIVDRHLDSGFRYHHLEFLANVAMFAPLGLLLILLLGRRRWWVVVLLGIVATCSIEFSQVFIPSRVPDTRDLIANTIGAIAGLLVGLPFAANRQQRQRTSTGSQPAIS